MYRKCQSLKIVHVQKYVIIVNRKKNESAVQYFVGYPRLFSTTYSRRGTDCTNFSQNFFEMVAHSSCSADLNCYLLETQRNLTFLSSSCHTCSITLISGDCGGVCITFGQLYSNQLFAT